MSSLRKIINLATKYTKIDISYLARGGFWSTVDFIVGSLLSFVLLYVFANFLPQETFGTYKYILSLAGSLSFLTLTGLNSAVAQAVAKTGNNGILPYAVKLQLKWNFFFTLVAGIMGLYYFWSGSSLLAYSLWLMAIAYPFDILLNTYGPFLVGKKDFKRSTLYGSTTNIIHMSALIIAALFSDSILFLLAAYLLFRILPNLFFYLKTVSIFKPEPLSEQAKQEFFSFTKHLSFVHILSIVAQYLDKILVFHYAGAVNLAIYGIATAVPERIRAYFKNIGGVMLPKISNKNIEEIKPVFYKRIWQGMLLGLAASLAYILLAPLLFRIFFPSYLESVPFSQVFSLILIFIIPATYFASVVYGQKMIKTIYASSLGGNALRIILYLILGKFWGIWGIIWANLSLYVFGTIYNLILWELEMKKTK